MSIIQQQAAEHLTRYVSDFVCNTKLADLPQDVVGLGKKSILDGLGLALSGGASHCGRLVRQHLGDLNLGAGTSTVIGTRLKIAPRFAAFANGVGIHADDYDDTQLAVATDRVYGRWPKPSAPAVPKPCWPTTSGSRWSARSPRRSTRATTRPASTPPRPAARSRQPPPPRA